MPLAGIIDMDAERAACAEIDKARGEIAKIDAKLQNPSFMERAKPEAIEEARTARRNSLVSSSASRWR